ncbi:PAS domain-containing sensor histidine kinase [Desulfurivibrio dismutans]|uniref:PAS domain-containing sensor histidine kinase n=1 Tax=Desulfurivibrio dismutans TaxID=1398908 RepID=UPI0023DB5E2D|nr:ATP-binding protein [Desulfurivibrio alkaliphilus]MDF1614814.1 ATP-binding protein [Desulfurivibrio alkaliphilus]
MDEDSYDSGENGHRARDRDLLPSEMTARIIRAKLDLESIVDCVGDLIVLVDNSGRIRRCNRAFAGYVGLTYQEIIGRDWEQLLVVGGLERGAAGSCEHGCREYHHPASGRIFCCRHYPLFGGSRERGPVSAATPADFAHPGDGGRLSSGGSGAVGKVPPVGEVITLQDVTAQTRLAEKFKANNRELAAAYDELKASQAKLLQQEKLASIGQLAAGVAHEINNPVGFVTSNLGTLGKYVGRLREFAAMLEKLIGRGGGPKLQAAAAKVRRGLKIDSVEEDVPELLKESLDGVERVKVIVQNLKNFARLDQAKFGWADINQCLEETLNIIWNELKYKAEVRKNYGELPPVWCHPQQLNQVFMNLLMNAAQAIATRGIITIKTRAAGDRVRILISDTGSGIAPEHLSRLFEPFFTTKEVGKGTGLGLSIVYDIVVKQHGGEIMAASAPGAGTTFRVLLPVGKEKQDE